MKRILITGITGFVGKQLLHILVNLKKKHELYLIVRNNNEKKYFEKFSNIKKIILTNDIFSEEVSWWEKQCKGVDIVIHLAWYVKTGLYLESPKNVDCLLGSLKLVRGAVKSGIKKFVGIGTCLEYDLSNGILSINTPLKPISSYASTKTALFLSLSSFLSANSVEFAWCRLFYLYGKGENRNRLTPYLHSRLRNGQIAKVGNGKKIIDFLNVEDAAKQIVKVTMSNQVGPVNICSGVPITIRQYAKKIANQYGRLHLLKFINKKDNLLDPLKVVGISNIK